jgi:hypothetical protein
VNHHPRQGSGARRAATPRSHWTLAPSPGWPASAESPHPGRQRPGRPPGRRRNWAGRRDPRGPAGAEKSQREQAHQGSGRLRFGRPCVLAGQVRPGQQRQAHLARAERQPDQDGRGAEAAAVAELVHAGELPSCCQPGPWTLRPQRQNTGSSTATRRPSRGPVSSNAASCATARPSWSNSHRARRRSNARGHAATGAAGRRPAACPRRCGVASGPPARQPGRRMSRTPAR